jgi:hypothetical protein
MIRTRGAFVAQVSWRFPDRRPEAVSFEQIARSFYSNNRVVNTVIAL